MWHVCIALSLVCVSRSSGFNHTDFLTTSTDVYVFAGSNSPRQGTKGETFVQVLPVHFPSQSKFLDFYFQQTLWGLKMFVGTFVLNWPAPVRKASVLAVNPAQPSSPQRTGVSRI